MPAVLDKTAKTDAPLVHAESSNVSEGAKRMRPRKLLILKGFIRKVNDDNYEGICLTLNLPARGRSLEEVDRKLRELIVAYLRDVANENSWDQFVPRRAPLSYYAAYYWYALLAGVNVINNDFKLFIESAPNCPAHA